MSERSFSEEVISPPRSNIACHVCRRRKIKCGRELPYCHLCQQSMQPCAYPEKPLKPGPKIGSTQTPRKRKSRSEPDKEEQPSRQQNRTLSTTDRAQLEPPANWTSASADPLSDLASAAAERQMASIQSLSFIIHPSHDSCSPDKRSRDDSPRSISQSQHGSHVAASCYSLGFHSEALDGLINQFFENFTSFQLFRELDFRKMLHQIETASQCKALLAAIMIFATKDHDQYDEGEVSSTVASIALRPDFIGQTLKYVDQAIYECEDLPISLPLLQTVILVTHWLLTQGVRGRAWRYLRMAVSSAYELNMHLIDAQPRDDDKVDPTQWVDDEERRRAWWAIWEMDVFASVIRRCPTGIDWSQNKTFLPCEDEKWQIGVPQKSCTLRQDITERYKALEASGNQSPKAWFIVINSLMKDAQTITSPISVETTSATSGQSRGSQKAFEVKDSNIGGHWSPKTGNTSFVRLCIIRNALQCTTIALPKSHRYRHSYLSFGIRELDRQGMIQKRLQHSSIYSIHTMVQLTKLMIYKYHLFQSNSEGISKTGGHQTPTHLKQSLALEQYSDAADEMVLLVNRSYEEHYKYVNPFLANTIWLAGAVQLLYRELAPLSADERSLANSKLEVLSMTYNRFVGYWNMSSTLQKNLEVVQSEIYNLQNGVRHKGAEEGTRTSEATPRPPFERPRPNSKSPATQSCDQLIRDATNSHGSSNVLSESYTREQTEAGVSGSTVGVTQAHNVMSSFHSIDACSYDSGSMLHPEPIIQQTTHCSVAGEVEPLLATVPQLPMLADDLVRQDNSLPIFGIAEPQPDMSPDFLSGMSFAADIIGSNNHLSNYFGEILSGGGVV